jgi:hypothetical protein
MAKFGRFECGSTKPIETYEGDYMLSESAYVRIFKRADYFGRDDFSELLVTIRLSKRTECARDGTRWQNDQAVIKRIARLAILERAYSEGKWREGTQRNLVAAALCSRKSWELDLLVEKLNWPAYWATVVHTDKNGRPSEDSWLMTKAGGIRRSVIYHLNELRKDELIKVAQE